MPGLGDHASGDTLTTIHRRHQGLAYSHHVSVPSVVIQPARSEATLPPYAMVILGTLIWSIRIVEALMNDGEATDAVMLGPSYAVSGPVRELV